MTKSHLIADIGGTNVRFALVTDDKVHDEYVLKCNDYHGLQAAAKAYIESKNVKGSLDKGAFAIAGPVLGDRFQMTNHPWSFSTRDVAQKLGLSDLTLLNDFQSIAMAIPHVDESFFMKFGRGDKQAEKPIIILGPGTGLGVSTLFWDGSNYKAVTGEGGHVTIHAKTQREFDIFQWLKKDRYTHISFERVCSGKGLVNIYDALRVIEDKHNYPDVSPEDITKAVLDGSNELAVDAWQMMTTFLASFAGNLALTLGAHGGIYIAGGIIPSSHDIFDEKLFRQEFEAKGRFESYLAAIPTYIVIHPFPAFVGLQAFLNGKQPG